MYEPLRHVDAEKKKDEELAKEASDCLAGDKNRQVGVTLLTCAFEPNFDYLTYDMQRDAYPTIERITNLIPRPDLRAAVVMKLTGLVKNTARRKKAEAQAELLDETIANEDATVTHLVQAFPSEVIALYGPLPRLWKLFMDSFPWTKNNKDLVNVVATLLEAFVEDRGELGQIMTHLRMRMLVDEKDWQTLIPVEKRMEAATTRCKHELDSANTPFTTRMEMQIVTPRLIAESIPLERLKPIFEEAEKLLDFYIPPPPPPVVESSPEAMKAVDALIAGDEKKDESKPEATEAKADDKPAEAVVSPHTDTDPPTSEDKKKPDESSNTDGTITVEEEELLDDSSIPQSNIPPADTATKTDAPADPPPASDEGRRDLDNLFEDAQQKAKANGDSVSPGNSGKDAMTAHRSPPPPPAPPGKPALPQKRGGSR